MPRINTVSIFAGVWSAILLVVSLPGVVSPALTVEFWDIVFIGSLALYGGALIGALKFDRVHRIKGEISTLFVDSQRLKKLHYSFVIGLCGSVALQVYSNLSLIAMAGGFSKVLSFSGGTGDNYKAAQMQVRAQALADGVGSGSLVVSVVGYVLFFGNLSIFTGALLWKLNSRLLAAIPIGVSAVLSVLTVQRTSFMMAGLLLIGTLLCLRSLDMRARIPDGRSAESISFRNSFAAFVIALFGFVSIVVPTAARGVGSRGASVFQSLVEYFIASAAGLNAQTVYNSDWIPPINDQHSGFGPSFGFGSYTFTGLASILGRLGLPVPNAPHAYDFYPVYLWGSLFNTNTGSSFLDFIMDFRTPGLVMMSFLLGFLAVKSHSASLSGKVQYVPIAAVLLATVFWSFFVNSLLGDYRYLLTAAIGGLLFKSLMGPAQNIGDFIAVDLGVCGRASNGDLIVPR